MDHADGKKRNILNKNNVKIRYLLCKKLILEIA